MVSETKVNVIPSYVVVFNVSVDNCDRHNRLTPCCNLFFHFDLSCVQMGSNVFLVPLINFISHPYY